MDKRMKASYAKIYNWAATSQRPGGESDWFAYDADGYVAAFATGGLGPVPDSVFLAGLESYLQVIDAIELRCGNFAPLHSGGFTPYQQRGMYAYDFQPTESGQYRLVCTPHKPLAGGGF